MVIKLQNPISRPRVISQVEISSITDESGARRVSAVVSVESIGSENLILWEGDSYDSAGQWTDSDAAARVLEIISAKYSAHE